MRFVTFLLAILFGLITYGMTISTHTPAPPTSFIVVSGALCLVFLYATVFAKS